MVLKKELGDLYFSRFLDAIAELQGNGIDDWEGKSFSIQRIYGGSNNALYKIISESETIACKLCVEDGRNRAVREFGALKAIQDAGFEIAPTPLHLDQSLAIVPFPIVFYRWVEGNILIPPISPQQLKTFLDSYHQLHRIQPSNHPNFQFDAWFHWFDFGKYLSEIIELFDLYTPWLKSGTPNGTDLRARLRRNIDECAKVIDTTTIDPSKKNIPLRLVRVDPNTANVIIGEDGKIHWVDWEYSGWGDPALDIAELRWHAALQPLGWEELKWLRTNYQAPFTDPEFSERLRIWDLILVTRWPFLILRVLWSNHNGPDRERLSRIETPSDRLLKRLVYYIELAENLFLGAEHVPNWC